MRTAAWHNMENGTQGFWTESDQTERRVNLPIHYSGIPCGDAGDVFAADDIDAVTCLRCLRAMVKAKAK